MNWQSLLLLSLASFHELVSNLHQQPVLHVNTLRDQIWLTTVLALG